MCRIKTSDTILLKDKVTLTQHFNNYIAEYIMLYDKARRKFYSTLKLCNIRVG